MSKEMWSQVKKFADGDNLDAETLNVPIGQLGERTAYLYARLKELWASGKMSSVILMDVKLSTEEGRVPVVGNAVYLDTASGRFAAAKATMSLYDDFTAAQSAFTVGILQKKDGDSGNVLVYGSLDLNPTGSPILVRDMIESGESFRPGRYYLSANEAGKLTAHPNGPLIYVCTVSGTVVAGGLNGKAVVTPQFLDLGQSHIHRTAVLTLTRLVRTTRRDTFRSTPRLTKHRSVRWLCASAEPGRPTFQWTISFIWIRVRPTGRTASCCVGARTGGRIPRTAWPFRRRTSRFQWRTG